MDQAMMDIELSHLETTSIAQAETYRCPLKKTAPHHAYGIF
jgi:hypothetical protein